MFGSADGAKCDDLRLLTLTANDDYHHFAQHRLCHFDLKIDTNQTELSQRHLQSIECVCTV